MTNNSIINAITVLGFNHLETSLVADTRYEELLHIIDNNDGLEIGLWDTDCKEWVELYV